MREVYITNDCLEYIDNQGERVSRKFFELVEVLSTLQRIHTNYVKKLTNTEFYELRIKAGNEYRTVLYTLDNEDFNQSSEIIYLYAFKKKSTKDYPKAIKQARKLLSEHLNNKDGQE